MSLVRKNGKVEQMKSRRERGRQLSYQTFESKRYDGYYFRKVKKKRQCETSRVFRMRNSRSIRRKFTNF